jgi:replicative DNA helicase
MKHAMQNLPKTSLYVDYESNRTSAQICSIASAFAAKQPLSLIVVDHTQIIDTNSNGKNYENRNIAIGQATRAFKILSKKLDCPVILLSQLNREEKHAVGKARMPRLGDLRDSGNIEQDADVVMLMHRETKPETGKDIKRTDLIVAKNRSGPTGEITIHFNPQNAMFSEYEQYSY